MGIITLLILVRLSVNLWLRGPQKLGPSELNQYLNSFCLFLEDSEGLCKLKSHLFLSVTLTSYTSQPWGRLLIMRILGHARWALWSDSWSTYIFICFSNMHFPHLYVAPKIPAMGIIIRVKVGISIIDLFQMRNFSLRDIKH